MLKRLVQNLMAVSGSHAVGALGNVVLVPLFLSRWSVESYGEWLALFGLAAYLSNVDAGLNMAAINRLTHAWAGGDLAAYRSAMHSAMAFYLTVVSAATALLAAAAWLLPLAAWMRVVSIPRQDAALVLLLLGIQILWSIPLGLMTGIYRTTGDLARTEWTGNAQRMGMLIVTAAVVLRGGGMIAVAAWQLLPAVLIAAYVRVDIHRRFPALVPGVSGARIPVLRQLIKPSLLFALIALSIILGQQGPVLIVSSVLGGAAVAVFVTSRTLANYMRQIVGALHTALWTDVTVLGALRGNERLRALHRFLVFGSTAACVAIASALWYAGPGLIAIWTNGRLKPDTTLLRWLLAMAVLQSPWLASSIVTAALNRHATLARAYMIAAIAGIALAVPLVRRFGASGVPAGLIVGELFACYHFVIRDTCRVIDEPYGPFARRLWGGLLAVAGSAMASGWLGYHATTAPKIPGWIGILTMTLATSCLAAWWVWLRPEMRLAGLHE